MRKVDQVGVASMERHDSGSVTACVRDALPQLWGVAEWMDHQHGLISRRGRKSVDAYGKMLRRSRRDTPAQQRRHQVCSPIPSSLLAQMRTKMPGLELRNADHEQIRRTVLTVTQSAGKQACLFAEFAQRSGPTSCRRPRGIHGYMVRTGTL